MFKLGQIVLSLDDVHEVCLFFISVMLRNSMWSGNSGLLSSDVEVCGGCFETSYSVSGNCSNWVPQKIVLVGILKS